MFSRSLSLSPALSPARQERRELGRAGKSCQAGAVSAPWNAPIHLLREVTKPWLGSSQHGSVRRTGEPWECHRSQRIVGSLQTSGMLLGHGKRGSEGSKASAQLTGTRCPSSQLPNVSPALALGLRDPALLLHSFPDHLRLFLPSAPAAAGESPSQSRQAPGHAQAQVSTSLSRFVPGCDGRGRCSRSSGTRGQNPRGKGRATPGKSWLIFHRAWEALEFSRNEMQRFWDGTCAGAEGLGMQ